MACSRCSAIRIAHENDAHRAVQAGLDITRDVAALSVRVRTRFGFDISVRVGIHRGLVYLDTAQDDVYGLGANFAARVCSIAAAWHRRRLGGHRAGGPRRLRTRGAAPADCQGRGRTRSSHYRVVGERDVDADARGPLVGRERELEYLQQNWTQASAGTLTTPGVAFEGEGGIGKSQAGVRRRRHGAAGRRRRARLFGSPFHTDVGLRPVRRLLERRCGIKRDSDPAERLRKLQAEVAQRRLDPGRGRPAAGTRPGHRSRKRLRSRSNAEGRKLYGQIAGAVHDYLLACLGVRTRHSSSSTTCTGSTRTPSRWSRRLLREASGRLMVVITGRKLPPLRRHPPRFRGQPAQRRRRRQAVAALHPRLAAQGAQRACRTAATASRSTSKRWSPSSRSSRPTPATVAGSRHPVRDVVRTAAVRPEHAARRRGRRAHRQPLRSRPAVLGGRSRPERRRRACSTNSSAAGCSSRSTKDSWRFHHELLREVAAEVSPPTVRRRLHSRIADALVPPPPTATPNGRWWHALRIGRAVRARPPRPTRQASADARRRGALNEARTYLKRALENLERSTPGRDRDRREIAARLAGAASSRRLRRAMRARKQPPSSSGACNSSDPIRPPSCTPR